MSVSSTVRYVVVSYAAEVVLNQLSVPMVYDNDADDNGLVSAATLAEKLGIRGLCLGVETDPTRSSPSPPALASRCSHPACSVPHVVLGYIRNRRSAVFDVG